MSKIFLIAEVVLRTCQKYFIIAEVALRFVCLFENSVVEVALHFNIGK